MRKPRLFIASSVESLPIAEAVNVNLDHELEVTIWRSGTFRLSSTTIDDLVAKSSTVDFALFIFAPDDIATIKSKKEHIVRDNVLFEMGLFIGAIGKERSFILKPRDQEMHLPTDLLGTTPADYDANRSDGDLASATNRACALIKSEVRRIGLIEHATLSETRRLMANPVEYNITTTDHAFLASCLGSQTRYPGGLAFHQIANGLRRLRDEALQIAAIKLERMGLVEKSIATDEEDGYEYYSYSITELGIDELLRNEEEPHPEGDFGAGGSDNTDNDIPF
jgi:hypothetical protein